MQRRRDRVKLEIW